MAEELTFSGRELEPFLRTGQRLSSLDVPTNGVMTTRHGGLLWGERPNAMSKKVGVFLRQDVLSGLGSLLGVVNELSSFFPEGAYVGFRVNSGGSVTQTLARCLLSGAQVATHTIGDSITGTGIITTAIPASYGPNQLEALGVLASAKVQASMGSFVVDIAQQFE